MTRQPFTHIRTHTGATPCHGNVHDHHITMKFKPSEAEIESTPHMAASGFIVIGEVVTARGQAFIVHFVAGPIRDTDVHSGFPHITISTADGVKPVESIQAIKDAIRDGTVMTRGEWSDIQFFGTVSDGGKVE